MLSIYHINRNTATNLNILSIKFKCNSHNLYLNSIYSIVLGFLGSFILYLLYYALLFDRLNYKTYQNYNIYFFNKGTFRYFICTYTFMRYYYMTSDINFEHSALNILLYL